MGTESLGRIAIVGLGGRFPGGGNLDQYWRMLADGVDGIRRFTADELLAAGVAPDLVGRTSYVRANGVLDDARAFDHELFGVPPREAEQMDPQQRVFLECAWAALEHAGYNPREGRGQVGVFAGSSSLDYLLHNLGDRLDIHQPTRYLQAWLGNDKDYLATQVAYRLNLRGPAVSVQTACSTSLVAVTLACQSLLTYQCDMALAGGVNVMEPQIRGYVYEEGNIVSPDGCCRAFDADAQGTVFGNGVGLVVLKRLEDAEEDGDTIHAVILGAAMNNDGAGKVGFTAPSVEGQAEVIDLALSIADVPAETISYVEAHGTGTALGDPIEVAALTEVFAGQTDRKGFCALGSVKSNIGHLNAASGIAGLIKTVLALQHGRIPPSLHYQSPNPNIDFAASPFYVNDQLREWARGPLPRRAGVSSFGIGGTNVHLIVEEAPPRPEPMTAAATSPHLLCLSAASSQVLDLLAERYIALLESPAAPSLDDLCQTANRGRAVLDHRLALVAHNAAEMSELLRAHRLATVPDREQPDREQPDREQPGLERRGLIAGTAADAPRSLAWVLSGQGSQLAAMGRDLYTHQPVFRAALDHCAEMLDPWLDIPLSSILFPHPSAAEDRAWVHQTHLIQPALFSYQMALARLLESWGVTPSVLFGHSLGEVSAACLAGVFSLDDGLRLVAERGRLMATLPDQGAMASIFTSQTEVAAELESRHDQVVIAAFNGPEHVVISGEESAVSEICAAFEARAVRSRRLEVSHAFHSPMMDPILDLFEEVVADIDLSPPRIELISGSTGQPIGAEIASPGYWRRSLRQPVRFDASMRSIVAAGTRHLLEVGPRGSLRAMARAFLDSKTVRWAPVFKRSIPESEVVRRVQAYLFVHDLPLDLAKIESDRSFRRVPAPTYPFVRREFWLEPPAQQIRSQQAHSQDAPYQDAPYQDSPNQAGEASDHPLMGRRIQSPLLEQTLFTGELSLARVPYLEDHRIYGAVVVSGAALVSMALDAVRLCFDALPHLTDVLFPSALIIPEQGGRAVQLLVDPALGERAGVKLISLDSHNQGAPGGWSIHLTASVASAEADSAMADRFEDAVDRERLSETLDPAELTAMLRGYQVELGPAFQWIRRIWRADGEALCRLERPGCLPEDDPYWLHPGLIDSCFQLIAACLEAEGDDTYVPFSISDFRLFARPLTPKLWCHTALVETDAREGRIVASLRLFDDDGTLVAELERFESRRAAPGALLRDAHREWVYDLAWREKPLAAEAAVQPGEAQLEQADPGQHSADAATVADRGSWVVLGGDTDLGPALAARLRQRDGRCVVVSAAAEWARASDESWQLDPAQGEHWARLWRAVLADGAPRVLGIIHLWSLAAAPGPASQAMLESAVERGCASSLGLVQGLLQTGRSQLPRLVLVTRGAQAPVPGPVPGHVSGPATAMGLAAGALWGLGRVLMTEHPSLRTVLIDLDSADPETGGLDREQAVAAIARELAASDGENQLVLGANRRSALRLARHRRRGAEAAKAWAPSPEGRYLVTGGFGALGLALTRWLVAQGVRHVVLSSRSEPSAAARSVIDEATASGVDMRLHCADVSQSTDVAGLIAAADDEEHPLRGVFHAAGVLDDAMLVGQDWERFAAVLAPKVTGSWLLHEATRDRDLDVFVCFSSIAAVLGSPGQANYAAANAFQDALAHRRHAEGLPALSVNWGPWGGAGMAASLAGRNRQRLAELGLGSIDPESGWLILSQLLGEGVPQAAVLPVDWARYVQQLPSGVGPPLLAELTGHLRREGAAEGAVMDALRAAHPAERREMLTEHIRGQVVRILGLHADETIEADQSLFDFDLDSLLAMDLRNSLEASLGISLNATVVFNNPTLETLVDFLARESLDLAFDAAAADDEPAFGIPDDDQAGAASLAPSLDDLESLSATLEGLSSDQLGDVLAKKLAELSADGGKEREQR